MKRIPFGFLGVGWFVLVYSTIDPRAKAATTRVAAYCETDTVPRGPRRTWTLEDSMLLPWGNRLEGDWPELDAAVARLVSAKGWAT